MDLKQWIELKKEKEVKAKSFPYGKTILNIKNLDVKEVSFIDKITGKEKTSYIITEDGKAEGFWAGKQVMKGIQEAVSINNKATQVEITKSGKGLNTTYSVFEVK